MTNPGKVAMHDVAITDDKCGPISGPSGDVNENNLLDTNEVWVYACQTRISASTRNVATAAGRGNGFTALDSAIVEVLVATPGFPDNGSLQLGRTVFVGWSRLNVRQSPALSGLLLGWVPAQAQGIIVGAPVEKDGYAWVKLQYKGGLLGWSVTEGLLRLSPVSPPLPSASSRFQIGDRIQVFRGMNVRAGAGLQQGIIGFQSAGNLGTLVSGPVFKDGYVWWLVNYANNIIGRTAEIGLIKAP